MSLKKEDVVLALERRNIIVDLVNSNNKATVANLSRRFSVSPTTIRNDLRELAKAGCLRRTHGGAICNSKLYIPKDQDWKAISRYKEKKSIARAALKYINEGDTIAVDSGTTTFELVKMLAVFRRLTVITNDLQTAVFLEENSDANIIIAGDTVRHNKTSMTGKRAVQTLRDLNVDKTFLTAESLSLKKGIFTTNSDAARLKSVLIGIADEVILLADSSKIEKTCFFRFADFSQIDLWITDAGAEDYIESFRRSGLDVMVCGTLKTSR